MKKLKASKGIFTSLVLVLLSALLILISLTSYSNHLQDSFQDEITTSLRELTQQSVTALEMEISEQQYSLRNIAQLLQQQNLTVDQMVGQLKGVADVNSFKRMGVVTSAGVGYTTDGYSVDFGDRDYFIRAMRGESSISGLLTDRIGGNEDKIIVFATPIWKEGRVSSVLFATFDNATYRDIIAIRSFDGLGYAYVVRSNGDVVVDSSHPNSVRNLENVLDSLLIADPSNEAAAKELRRGMADGQSGYIQFVNTDRRYMYYEPMHVNDWYLLSVVPASVVGGRLNFIMTRTYLLGGILVVLFLLLLLHIIRIQSTNRRHLEGLAYVDPLTGGRSSAKFILDAEACLDKWQRGDGGARQCAIVCLDVDKFKFINDLFGYDTGDQVLRMIHEELGRHLGKGEPFARYMADHFELLLFYSTREELLDRLAGLYGDICRAPAFRGVHYDLSLSVGIYEVPREHPDVPAMISRAELPANRMKNNRTAFYAFFDDELRQRELYNHQMESAMSGALERREFVVYFQPQYRAALSTLAGAEALVRWAMPDGRLVYPDQFIPLFESNGTIVQLDLYVFERVCEAIRAWLDAGLAPVPVSVNLSQLHLYVPHFVEQYRSIRDRYRIPPGLVELELTESALFDNFDRFSVILDQLHEAGFSVLMDDFGTGYSSLNMLGKLPVDVLKLDRGFVAGQTCTQRGQMILGSIIQLAHSLKMRVVAEGVETQEQYEFLRDIQCDLIQGYYFARPLPPDQMEGRLRGGFPESPPLA